MKKASKIIDFNRSILAGQGALGLDFLNVLKRTEYQSGKQYIEILVDPNSGQFLEILFPNPTRSYQVARIQKDGSHLTTSSLLSKSFPEGVLVTLAVDSLTQDITSLSLHERMDLDIIAVLHASIVMGEERGGKIAA